MAKFVTLSCVSHAPPTVSAELSLGGIVDAFIEHWRRRLETVLLDEPDLVVLPEYCDHPSTHRSAGLLGDYVMHRGQKVRDFFSDIARQHHTYIAYCACRVGNDGSLYNSLQVLDRDGDLAGIYDKHFLTPGERAAGLQCGDGLPLFDLDFGRVAPAICFDMQFAEYRANRAAQRPDLLLFSSEYHGGIVQNAWAFESRAYFVGSVLPPAPCSIISPLGELIGESINYRDDVSRTVNFDVAVLARGPNLTKFAEVKRRYRSKVRIHNPGRLGAVLLTSETDELTVNDVIDEFGLEPIDNYHERMRDCRREARTFAIATTNETGATQI